MPTQETSNGTNRCSPVKDDQPHRSDHSPADQSPPAAVLRSENKDGKSGPDEKVIGSPFDRWRPLGGGDEQDIFRRFNIQPAEEADFLTYWSQTRLSTGIFARDTKGTLVFRISPTDLTDLSELDIGNSCGWSRPARWLHMYDGEGVSWLTQSRPMDLEAFPQAFDCSGRLIQQGEGRGSCWSSDAQVGDAVARRRIAAELARITG
jgi:hypothetical protein